MGDIQFDDEPSLLYTRVEASTKKPKLVEWVIDKGWADDARKATSLLLIIATIVAVVAIVFPLVFGGSGQEVTEEIPK